MKIFLLIMVMIAIVMIIAGFMGISKRSKMTPQELNNLYDKLKINKDISNWGPVSPAYICPHCQEKGSTHYANKEKERYKRRKGNRGSLDIGLFYSRHWPIEKRKLDSSPLRELQFYLGLLNMGLTAFNRIGHGRKKNTIAQRGGAPDRR